jgi:hypothetical protein
LVQGIFELIRKTGRDPFPEFLKLFDTQRLGTRTLRLDDRPRPLPESARTALFLAALTTVFGEDVREFFEQRNFVIDQEIYERGLDYFRK